MYKPAADIPMHKAMWHSPVLKPKKSIKSNCMQSDCRYFFLLQFYIINNSPIGVTVGVVDIARCLKGMNVMWDV